MYIEIEIDRVVNDRIESKMGQFTCRVRRGNLLIDRWLVLCKSRKRGLWLYWEWGSDIVIESTLSSHSVIYLFCVNITNNVWMGRIKFNINDVWMVIHRQ